LISEQGYRVEEGSTLSDERVAGHFVGAHPSFLRAGTLAECSFCGRRPPESGRLVSGTDALICEHCVAEWFRVLASEDEPRFAEPMGMGSESVRPIGPAMVRRVVRHYEGDWRAMGVDIILAETADREQIRGSDYIWEVAGDPTKQDRDTPMTILSPAGAMDEPNCRAVVTPIPSDSPLWGLEGRSSRPSRRRPATWCRSGQLDRKHRKLGRTEGGATTCNGEMGRHGTPAQSLRAAVCQSASCGQTHK
jgi:hypothetical protein